MANSLKVALKIEAVSNALNPIRKTQQAINALSEKSNQLKIYDKSKSELNQANKTLRDARLAVRKLHQERAEGEGVTQKWRAQIKQANEQVNRAKIAADAHRKKMSEMADGLKKAGLSTQNLGNQQQNIVRKIKLANAALKAQRAISVTLSTAWKAAKFPFSALKTGLIYGGLMMNTLGMVGGRIKAWMSPFVGTAAALEDFQSTMEALNGTGEKSMRWIDAFARKNPVVPITQLAKAFEDLTLAGMPVEKTLQSVVDYNAGIGKSAQNANAIIDVLTKDWNRQRVGVGSSNALNRLGVPVFELLARYSQRTQPEGRQQNSKDFADMAKRGALGRDAIKALMEQMQFEQEGAAAKTQTSWNGLMDELSSRWQLFQKDLMDHGVFDALKQQLGRLSDWLSEQAKNGNIEKWANDISNVAVPAIDKLAESLANINQYIDSLKTVWDYSFGFVGKAIGEGAASTVMSVTGDKTRLGLARLKADLAEHDLAKLQAERSKRGLDATGAAMPTVAQAKKQAAEQQEKAKQVDSQRNSQPSARVIFSFDGNGMPRFDLQSDSPDLVLESNVGYNLVGAY